MHTVFKIFVLTGILGILTGAKAVKPPTVSCEHILAYGIDPDPNGANLRQGPGTSYAILSTTPAHQPEQTIGVEIIGATGQWLLVKNVKMMLDVKPFYNYASKAWIYGALLGTTARGYDKGYITLYQWPSQQSKTVGKVRSFESLVLKGCNGQWLKVAYQHMEGWIDNASHCPNPFTTCP